MPRRARIHIDGIPLHIVQRGHNREPCFFAEEDYSSYLHWLSEALTETERVTGSRLDIAASTITCISSAQTSFPSLELQITQAGRRYH